MLDSNLYEEGSQDREPGEKIPGAILMGGYNFFSNTNYSHLSPAPFIP